MFFFLPDLSASTDDPRMIGVRRFVDLYLALYDHLVDGVEPDHEDFQSRDLAGVVYTMDCGYDLRIELRARNGRVQIGFTLVEAYHGYLMPALRMVRRLDAPWTAFQLNMDKASPEFQRFVGSLGLEFPARRYEFSDLAANIVFGKCCEMMRFGFLRR